MHVKRLAHRACCAGVALLAACSPEGSRGHGGRGVLVLAIDSLRLDHLGAAGYDRDTTPTLDGLLDEGIWFEQAFSAAPSLIPAHAALLTGCDPRIARQPLPEEPGFLSLSRMWRVPSATPSLAAEFLAQGYSTAAFVDHPWLVARYGFDRGFEVYNAYSGDAPLDNQDIGARGIGRDFSLWLSSLDSDADWFAYLDLNDLERAGKFSNERWDNFFQPRPELDSIPPVARGQRVYFAVSDGMGAKPGLTVGDYEAHYDGALRQLDTKLSRLFAKLESRGRFEETTICLVGSYGIGFGESGLYLDHGTLSDVDLAVPMLIRPGKSREVPRGVRSPHLASTYDLMPTLLELHDIEVPSGVHGVSQLPALQPGASAVREFAFSAGGLNGGFAVHDARYSFQAVVPATRGDRRLEASWYGVGSPENKRPRRFLRDRTAGEPPGDLGTSAHDPERELELHAAGDDWFHWIQLARNALHDPPWLEEPVSAEELEELRARGLIPAEREGASY